MLVVIPADFGRHCTTGMGEQLKEGMDVTARIVMYTVHVLDLDEIGQQVCDVLNCVRITKFLMAESAFRQPPEEEAY